MIAPLGRTSRPIARRSTCSASQVFRRFWTPFISPSTWAPDHEGEVVPEKHVAENCFSPFTPRSGVTRTCFEFAITTLEVSRETVRGAIQMLAAIGMVEISQGSRTRVIGTIDFPLVERVWGRAGTRRSANEVYEARCLVELPTVRLAVERIDNGGIQRLKRLVEAQREMTGDPVRFQISDAEFHDVIYRAGGNPLLADFLHEMYSFGLEFRRRVLLEPDAVSRSLEDHIHILDGFERRDATAAVEAMDKHLDRIHRTTLEVMDSRSRGDPAHCRIAELLPCPAACAPYSQRLSSHGCHSSSVLCRTRNTSER
ncbi:MAG: FadR family transcriptional regulator [Mesorhizobium sp.]|nr:MAG: FadR family transcriptional regulator [Mesorhizobium sp.]RWJ11995.1 MAG: FadR family transcriptional regulator [Mesorhizobium sp.]